MFHQFNTSSSVAYQTVNRVPLVPSHPGGLYAFSVTSFSNVELEIQFSLHLSSEVLIGELGAKLAPG